MSYAFLQNYWWCLVALLGGYVLLREVFTALFGPREGDDRILQASRRGPVTLFVPLVVLVVLTVAFTLPFPAVAGHLRRILLAETLFFYAIAFIRRARVLSSFNGFFKTRFYLFMMEIVPGAALAAFCFFFE